MSLKLTVITDTHYYSPETGICGSAYENALMRSQKLLGGARELLISAFNKIANDKTSDIVLIAGDVTNDGEEAAHNEFREMLRTLKSKGKKVYVITATHDYKEKCKKYVGDEIKEMPGLTREKLFDFYREFGADEAISCKPEYMSYVVQLPDNIRLFALNDDNGIEGEYLSWVKEQAEDARINGQFVVAMTHHPIIPPSPMYELIGKGDMHRNYKDIRKMYADMGIQLMLTGHTHTHNIGRIFSDRGNAFYAVSTGALVGYPAPIRKLTIDNGTVTVKTEKVETADIDTNSLSLEDYLKNQLIGVIGDMIKAAGSDIDKFAYMGQAISIKPKLIYKFGWIIKPIFKWLNNVKFGTFAKWTKKETGLKKEDWKNIKDEKVVDFIISLVSNLFSGENNMTLDNPKCRIYIGFLRIIDSILSTVHIDLGKIIKVAPNATALLAPLACKGEFDAYETELEILSYLSEDEYRESVEYFPEYESIPKSKKGPAIIVFGALFILVFLPLLLVILLFGFLKNQIKYGKKIKG